VAEAVELPSVRVVDAASLPFQPASPNVPKSLAVGLALALLSGLGVALVRELKDTKVRERQEVERQTGLPVLTIVPHLHRPGSVMPLLPPPRQGAVGKRGKWRKRDAKRDSYRPTMDAQVALECFRSLAADLGFAGRATGDGGFRSVAVTSAGREEGKTLTACNLALVRAADGVRTLLIDGDMRGGRVARFFGFAASSLGLSDVLAGSAEVSGVWQGVAGQATLWVVPAGTPSQHSTTLLGSEAFGRILEWARMQFELIIVDTPPLNVISDAAAVAAVADAVIVVVRDGKTERDALEMTLARLARAGGNVVGVVLNDVSLSREHVGGYSYAQASRPG
jgi:capsular exopolysaccharide synthesis family protein